MDLFDWSDEKNETLRLERGVSFEEVPFHVARGDLLDVLEHKDPDRYPGQRVFLVNAEGYVWIVPFVEREGVIFLKTIIPSRRMTKKYLGER